MVPRVGIEPTTPGLGNLCSIQLSYRGMGQNIRYAGEKNANYKTLTHKVDKTHLICNIESRFLKQCT